MRAVQKIFISCLLITLISPTFATDKGSGGAGGSASGAGGSAGGATGDNSGGSASGAGGTAGGFTMGRAPMRTPDRSSFGQNPRSETPLEVPESSNSCMFKPEMSATDQALMAEIDTVIESLRAHQNANCPVPENFDINTLSTAISTFNSVAGLDGPGGNVDGFPTNCFTYESDLDRRFNQFVQNIDGSRVNFQCPQPNREDAIQCAMDQVARMKSTISQSCEAFRNSEQGRAVLSSAVSGLNGTVSVLNQLISNPNCANSSQNARRGLLNVGLELAGRASSFVPIGGASLAVSAITDLAQNAIQSLFNSRAQMRDPNVQAEVTKNFRNLACTYQELEKRARNCDRLALQENFDAMKPQYQRDCEVHPEPSTNMSEFLGLFDQITAQLSSPVEGRAPASEASNPTAATYDLLINFDETPFPGNPSPGSFLEVGVQSANAVADHYETLLRNDLAVADVLQRQGQRASALRIQQFRENLGPDLQRARQMREMMNLMAQKVNDPSNLNDLHERMISFPGNFREVFAQTLRESAQIRGDVAEQIDAYNGSVAVMARMEEYQNVQRRLREDDLHARDFKDRLHAVQPHLKSLTEDYLDIVEERLTNAARAGTRDENTRQIQWEDNLRPVVLACNNLRSAMVDVSRRTFDATEQHNLCEKLSSGCQNDNGIKSFNQYLQQTYGDGNDRRDAHNCGREGDCETDYSRYVCKRGEETESLVNNLKDEFTREGKVCGLTLAELTR